MRIRAHLREPSSRIGVALRGLARRGHVVAGIDPGEASGEVAQGIRPERWRARADVVVTDAPRPLGAMFAGWLAGAHCLVAALRHDEVSRWGVLSHWAWQGLSPFGIVEAAEAEAFEADAGGLALDRIGVWSDMPPTSVPDPAHPDVEILERACERVIARHRSHALRPAWFLDRDGTLVPDVGYTSDPGDVELFPGTAEALRMVAATGYTLVVISNQAGVGRGLFDLTRAYEVMARMRELLRREGVELDAIYLCPHRPDEGCACRKPGTALLERAADDLGLGLRDSVMVGDKWIDVAAGHRVGAAGVLVRTGYGREEEKLFRDGERKPDVVCDDLKQVAAWILSRPERS